MADDTGRIINLGAERGAADLSRMMGKLARAGEHGFLATLNNAMLILTGDPMLRDCFGLDEFKSEPLLMRAPPPLEEGNAGALGPYPRAWQPEDVFLVQAYLQRRYAPRFSRETTEAAMLYAARERRFHRPREWLASLKWDGVRRLNTWLHVAFGTLDDDYHAATGAKFMIAAVRRMLHPGCKFDVMPILEGPQGLGKSQAIAILFGEEWFSDNLPDALNSKDAAMALLGVWVLELAEIQHLVRSEPETVKAFLSRAVDRYRPPYGKAYVERPRQGVLIGTTNVYDYLRDATGNRRFWPWRCAHADRPWLRDHRRQLWAEAVAREAMGESIWLDDADAVQESELLQENRLEEDTWLGPVETWLSYPGRTTASAGAVLAEALGIPLERHDQRQKRRVTAIFRQLGWVQGDLARDDKTRVRMWRKGP